MSEELSREIDQQYAHKPGPKAFEAAYDGTCGHCYLPIESGDTVHYRDSVLVHHRHHRLEQAFEICDRCWLTKPCECD